jgi:hypothetical protein
VELGASLLRGHLLTQHGVTQVVDVDLAELEEREGSTFAAHWPEDGKVLTCPVPGCMGTTTTTWNLQRHFNDRHPLDMVITPGEGVYPRCRLCGLQTNPC